MNNEHFRGPGRYSADHSIDIKGEKTGGKISNPIPSRPNTSAEVDLGAWRPVNRNDHIEIKQATIIGGKACVPCRIFGCGK